MVYLEERVEKFYQHKKEGLETPLLPNNIEVEEAILGGCLIDPSAYNRIGDILSQKHFYIDSHRQIWKAIEALGKRDKPTDMMSVASLLQDRKKLDGIGGTNKLAELVERTVSSVNIDRYAILLKRKATQRQLISFGHECIEWGYEQSIDEEHLPQVFERVQARLNDIAKFPIEQTPLERKRAQLKQLLQEVESILLDIEDIAFRAWLMKDLETRYGMSSKALETLYYKSLIGAKNGKSLSLKELREQYGGDYVKWSINAWLPKGSATLLHAPGGTGKSLFMYDLLYHLLTGEDWNEFPVMKKSKCLLIQTDEAESDLISHLTARGFIDVMPLKIKSDWGMEFLPQLYKEIQKEQYDAVFIDSLTSVSRFSCMDENGTEYALPILQLNNIASKTNCHIFLLHHSNKTDGSARGTSAIQAAVSQVLKMEFDKDSSDKCERIVTFTKSRVRSPGAYRLRLNADEELGQNRNYWTLVEEIDTGILGKDVNVDLKTRIKAHLKRNSHLAFTCREIATDLETNYDTTRRVIARLIGTGEISRQERPGKIPNLYFLGEPESLGDRSIDSDRKGDRQQNPDTAKDSLLVDHAIAKNQKNSEVISPNFDDRAIDKDEKELEPSNSNISVVDRFDDRLDGHPDRDRQEEQKSPEAQIEENIENIREMLDGDIDRETFEEIVKIALNTVESLIEQGIDCPDLLEAAIARLSPERQAKIEQLDCTEVDAGNDNVQNHPPVEETHDEQAIQSLIEKIENCRTIDQWHALEQESDSELLAIAFQESSPQKQTAINKQLVFEQQEKRRIERELRHVNPFEEGDTVILKTSPCRGFGTIVATRKNQCRVRFDGEKEPSTHYDSDFLKVGQLVYYIGSDPSLQKYFVDEKANQKKYKSVPLTIKSMRKEEGFDIAIELTRDEWSASFWVNLCDIKR